MKVVGVRELRDNLADHLEHVADGEEIVIVQRSKPIARLLPYEERPMSEDKPPYMLDDAEPDPNEQFDQLLREDLAGFLAFNAYHQEHGDKQAAVRALAEAILKVQALP